MSYSVDKTEDEWREELGEEQYAVLRHGRDRTGLDR